MTSFNWDEMIETAADIEDSFELIPPGSYDVIVLEASAVQSRGGNDMIKVTYQFPDNGPNAKRRLWNQHVIIPGNAKNLGFFLRAMSAYGLTKEWLLEAKPSFNEVADKIIGQVVNVRVMIEDHWEAAKAKDGEKVNRVSDPKPAVGDTADFGSASGSSVPIPSVAPTPRGTSEVPDIPSF